MDVRRAESMPRVVGSRSATRLPVAGGDGTEATSAGLGALTFFSEETRAGGSGAMLHARRDLELITYVAAGTVQHGDGVDELFTLPAGAVECISFGTGARYVHRNASATDPVRLVLMCIVPRAAGGPAALGVALRTRSERQNRLLALVLPDDVGPDAGMRSGRYGGTPRVRQGATVYAAALSAGVHVTHALDAGRGAYVYVLSGGVAARSGTEVPALLAAGDVAAITDVDEVRLSGIGAAEILVVDVPLIATGATGATWAASRASPMWWDASP